MAGLMEHQLSVEEQWKMALNPQNLTPFKKGESGNPSGRPKGIENSKTRMLRLLQLTEKINNPVTGELEEFSVLEQIDMMLIAKARKGDIRAIQELLDRIEGKAGQTLEVNQKNTIRIILQKYGLLEEEDARQDKEIEG
jgi:hypothetical protein